MKLREADLGIAFSGGGTRSASATVGQLRGLEQNGWLSRVRYMTAVSGGSWAAVPYTYSRNASLVELLGEPRPIDPGTGQRKPLNPQAIQTVPDGLIAARIVESKLGHVGIVEAPSFLPDTIAGRDLAQTRRILQMARSGIRKFRKNGMSRSRTVRTRPTHTCSVRCFSTASSRTGIAGSTPGTTRAPWT